MPDQDDVAEHYDQKALFERITDAVDAMGHQPPVPPEVLSPVDEFHIGGRVATQHLFDHLGIRAGQQVLDIGCGIGGPARFASQQYGAQVTGVDLTAEFVSAGNALSELTGQSESVTLVQGNALKMPFENDRFDAVYMIHVGMNIADKDALFSEVARVLMPGGVFAIYDVMQMQDDTLVFPVPWASGPDLSAVATPEGYRMALSEAGFDLMHEENRRAFAVEFFEKMAQRQVQSTAPPMLGLHLVMGQDTPSKVKNMMSNVRAGRIAPVEMISRLSK